MLETTSVTSRDTSPQGGAPLRLRAGAVTWREIDGELVLLDLETSSYLNVNAAGTVLWAALERGTDAASLAAALSAHFDIPVSTASRDVEAFVADVRERGYLAG